MAQAGSPRRAGPSESGGLHTKLVESLGSAIAEGALAEGSVIQIEELEERYAVSRSVVREALRVLAAMGLVAMRRRLGIQILPANEWNVFAPRVIQWRLASAGRFAQLRSLTELRGAVEPEAARLAATRASEGETAQLLELAGELWAAGQSEDAERFLRVDTEFHRFILAASGNEMFAALHPSVAEVLAGRTHFGLMPSRPHPDALQLHMDVAAAVQRSDPDAAYAAMRAIMTRTMAELSELHAPDGGAALGDASSHRGAPA
ncbi:FadR/GntR family transcriptional regulator [Sinomonas atrocyanea]|uniref:FadR/GntR family transcriptional regulator n=1 Tax=Sinomonas atrocyanea TaxID=37927 RepID=UPI00278A2B90|nr:FCD domain-containing protein [Sinomonas atrocyanea]MDQ0260857.1 DNA-binding FadR family transcriptional regulator [Sinomonas atrocyanea]MDR6621567.1 DNA-binding FadR family transcriptional regulator [Sinomonas atrocyanea]